jgi:hypothetical protein
MPTGVFLSKDKHRNPNSMKLTAWDFHAQAGMIFGRISRMPMDQQLWVFLTYGNVREQKVCARMLAMSLTQHPEVVRMGLSKLQVRRILLSSSVRRCASEASITQYQAHKIRGILNPSGQGAMIRALDDLAVWLKIDNGDSEVMGVTSESCVD